MISEAGSNSGFIIGPGYFLVKGTQLTIEPFLYQIKNVQCSMFNVLRKGGLTNEVVPWGIY